MQRRVTTLRNHLLPRVFNATGLYSDRVHERAAAFRLLTHAEFESYLEDVVTEHVTTRVTDWRQNRRPSLTLAALLAYFDGESRPPESLLQPPPRPGDSFETRLDAAVAQFQRKARVLNHGVRERNVLSLLLPIGVAPADLDMQWLTTLDSWASERGEIAHQSSGKVRLQLDPAREYQTVKQLRVGFRNIDTAVSALP